MEYCLRQLICALFIIVSAASRCAADTLPDEIVISYEGNSTADNNQTTAPDGNITVRNWFYYRNFLQAYEHYFLTNLDATYLYGTDAVIVVGSGIDYTLYHLLTSYGPGQRRADANVTQKKEGPKKAERNFFKDGFSNENSEKLEQYLLTQTGKLELPEQLYSPDKRRGEQTYLISEWFSDKNIDDTFLDRTNRSYVRLRGGYAYNYRGSDEYIYSIAARVSIPRTQEKFDLIIGDDTKNSSDLSLEGTEAERDNSVALGMNNLLDLTDPVKTRIRLGFAGIANPYAKIAFSYEALVSQWLILPNQTFRYSAEDAFEEWTNIEFKRKIIDQMIFSLLTQRSTITGTDGMHYFVQPTLSFTLGKYGNFTPYLGMYGRTRAQPETLDGYIPKRGVYRYAVGLNWSKQAKRKYIVYRLQPIVSYDDQYAFKANYYLKALLEFYFGLRD